MAFTISMRVLGAVTSVYMLLVMTRVILTWFPSALEGRAFSLLSSATDPFLDIFRRIKFLRSETVDFSPVAAMAVLSVVTQIFTTAAAYGRVTVGFILALVLRAVWSFFAFFLAFLGLAMVARLIAYLARWNSLSPIWRVVDALINPVLYRLNRFIYRNRIVNFRQSLITGILVFLGLWMAGNGLIGLVAKLLTLLPF
jgi:YggT family protein